MEQKITDQSCLEISVIQTCPKYNSTALCSLPPYRTNDEIECTLCCVFCESFMECPNPKCPNLETVSHIAVDVKNAYKKIENSRGTSKTTKILSLVKILVLLGIVALFFISLNIILK
jgi:hypothetical protein